MMLTCSKCLESKPDTEFSIRKSRPRGRNSHCKTCTRKVNKSNYDAKQPAQLVKSATYRASNQQAVAAYQAAYRDANREKLREYHRQYARDHSAKVHAKVARRRASKMNATPGWADSVKIQGFYDAAKSLGSGWHVDHIVPLVSAIVCGLHCEANLRLIPAVVNLTKGNKFWPDMPTAI